MKKILILSAGIILLLIVPHRFIHGHSIFSVSPLLNQEENELLNAESWIEDLEFMVNILKTRHPNLYYQISEEEFTSLVLRLKKEIPDLSNEEIVIRLMQLVSKIQDGHTWIYPYGDLNFDKWFPLRFNKFTDGLFITVVDEQYKTILGCKVLRIGKTTAEEAFESVGKITFADNIFGKTYSTPLFLSNSQVLKTFGIINSLETLPLEVESPNGDKMKVDIKGLKSQFDAFWFIRPDAGPPGGKYVSIFTRDKDSLPLHLKNRRAYYWYEYLKEDKTIYLQVNAILDSREETFQEFTERFWKYVEEHKDDIQKFILDLRYNAGGNGYLLLPFIHEFIKHEDINQRGKLFTIVSHETVSAGVTALALMKKHTHMISVGEPPGTSINFFSNANVFQLPNSEMYMWVSSLNWQRGHPADKSYFSPDIPFVFTGKDFFSGQDPVIEAIVKNKVRLLSDILWEKGGEVFQKEYNKITHTSSPLSWWKPNSRSMFEDIARRLFEEKRYDDALIALEVNTRIFPQFWETWIGLATVHAECGNYDKALAACNKALEISPANGSIWRVIEQIKEKK